MCFDDEQGSIGELREIGKVMQDGFRDANGNTISAGFYTNSNIPNSFYFISLNPARNLVVESPNNPPTDRLTHNYSHLLDVHSYTQIPAELVETMSEDFDFIQPRLRKQRGDKFIRVTCRILDRLISGEPLVK